MPLPDFLPTESSAYRAVVNPTGLVIQARAYGRIFTFVPGVLDVRNRCPVQMITTRLARKAQRNQRRFLEIMSVERGYEILRLAKELNDFPEAYRRVTGRTGKKAGEVLRIRQERMALRRVLLQEHGVPDDILKRWTIGDMRSVIKDPALAGDLDEQTGRPNLDRPVNDSIHDVIERVENIDFSDMIVGDEPKLLSGDDRIPETGLPEDTLDEEQIEALLRESDAEANAASLSVEELAAKATADFDIKHGGRVKGDKPATVAAQEAVFKGVESSGEEESLEPKDLEHPLEVPDLPVKTEQQQKETLRLQIDQLAGRPEGRPVWHGRSGVAKLEEQLAGLVEQAAQNG